MVGASPTIANWSSEWVAQLISEQSLSPAEAGELGERQKARGVELEIKEAHLRDLREEKVEERAAAVQRAAEEQEKTEQMIAALRSRIAEVGASGTTPSRVLSA